LPVLAMVPMLEVAGNGSRGAARSGRVFDKMNAAN